MKRLLAQLQAHLWQQIRIVEIRLDQIRLDQIRLALVVDQISWLAGLYGTAARPAAYLFINKQQCCIEIKLIYCCIDSGLDQLQYQIRLALVVNQICSSSRLDELQQQIRLALVVDQISSSSRLDQLWQQIRIALVVYQICSGSE